jgi:hypothetical protein
MGKQGRKSWLFILTAVIIMMRLTEATWAAPGQNPHRDTVPSYTLTVNVVGNGSVTVDPAGPSYTYGTVVTLTTGAATPPASSTQRPSPWTGTRPSRPPLPPYCLPSR